MDKCACPARQFYYVELKRRPAKPAPALVQGLAMHAGLHVLDAGGSVTDQEAAIDAVYAQHRDAVPLDDYRQPPYVKAGLAQYRADYPSRWATVEESEVNFERTLGTIEVRGEPVEVRWRGRRDHVVIAADGLRYIVDYKTRSRDDKNDWKIAQADDQLIGYAWAYQDEHPDKPVHGALFIRLIMRPPSKNELLGKPSKGVKYEFPHDPPIYFSQAQITEWREQLLVRAAAIAARRPDHPEDWPLERTRCSTRWGPCEYLDTCLLPADQRRLHLSTDLYEDVKPHGGDENDANLD
jgi:PD-(D/E)XK nuclease superfamily